jgi:uncharacterized protein (TIGR03435 family)
MSRSKQRLLAIIFVQVLGATLNRAQTPATRSRFEVASIKRNTSCGGRRGGGGAPTPGRLNMECATLQTLIENAYYIFADGVSMNPKSIEISGGPNWMLSDTYEISAKAEDGAPFAQMAGPMMQALLEERFGLELHYESKEAPVYFLTVAKSGPKLEPTKEGSCVAIDINHAPTPAPGQPRLIRCGSQGLSSKNGMFTMNSRGITMELLANDAQLTRIMGRPIVDKTGLSGRFDVHLEFALDTSAAVASGEATAPPTTPVVPAGALIFEAFQQLGLKLEPGKGSVKILIIDRLERPSEN